MREALFILVRFVLLIMLQALVLNNIDLGSWSPYFNGFLYIMFILMLPFEMPKWGVIVLSFLLGLALDMYMNTPGMHASACALVGFLRPGILRMLASADEYEFRNKPTIAIMGFVWYFSYALLMALVHHFWLYLIEDFRLVELHIVLFKAICSGLLTTLLIIITQYLIFRSKSENG